MSRRFVSAGVHRSALELEALEPRLLLSAVLAQQALLAASTFMETSGQLSDTEGSALRDLAGAWNGQDDVGGLTVQPLQDSAGTNLAYLIQRDGGGYVIVAGDDTIDPIVAYSWSGSLLGQSAADDPLLDMVEGDMASRLEAEAGAADAGSLWAAYLDPSPAMLSSPSASRASWGPLISFPTFNQTAPYNDYVPVDPTTGERSLVGCVATSMAEMAYYWQYPLNLSFGPADAYVTATNGIQIPGDSVADNFPDFTALNAALSTINYDFSDAELAYLSFGAGIKAQMDYGSDASGAYMSASLYTSGLGFASASLSSSWPQIQPEVIQNIKDGQPVQLGVSGSGAGHSVIVDGYNDDGSFHVNMGWGGYDDAWYFLPNIAPSDPYANYTNIDDVIYDIVARTPSAPDTPTNISPSDGTTGISLTPTLTASAFHDADRDTQLASQWEVVLASNGGSVYNSGVVAAATSWTVPGGTLDYSTNYRWDVRYEDSQGNWSSYSSKTSFQTAAPPPQPPVTPTNIAPSNATNVSLTPTLVASAFNDPDGDTQLASQWQVFLASSGENVYDSGIVAAAKDYALPSGYLTYSTYYRWDVRYQDSRGNWSSYSAETLFRTGLQPPQLTALNQWASGQTTVTAYHVEGGADVNPNDILVKFGKDNSVSSISLAGTQSMSGLGIAISGASSVGKIKDARQGPLGDLAFIASDAPIKSIALNSGMSGFNINGLTVGGLVIPQNIDGDRSSSDANAIYSEGAIGKLSFTGDIAGDVFIGGTDPKKGLAFGSISSKTGSLTGDLLAMGGGGKFSLGGSFASNMRVEGALKGFQLKGGKGGGGDFCAGASLTVGGLLKSLKITTCEEFNAGSPFGIYADEFGKLGIGTWKLSPLDLPFNQNDFWVTHLN